jgi:hypothetical protein
MSSAQLNAKKKGFTVILSAFCSFAFMINLNSVLSFKTTTRTAGPLFQDFGAKSRALLAHASRKMPQV